jgi:hypothetical protein
VPLQTLSNKTFNQQAEGLPTPVMPALNKLMFAKVGNPCGEVVAVKIIC